MAESVHGRHVLQMVIASERSWPRADLHQALADQFGEVAFHTCSAHDMNANELIELFLAKGKLVETADGITVDPSKMCGHKH